MRAKDLFDKIIRNNDIVKILEQLEMHHIQDKGEYYSCGFNDGDNTKSVVIYKDNLWVNAYTRDIADSYGYTNIISLVEFVKKLYYSKAVKWICDICKYDYYEEPTGKTEMLKFLDYIYSTNNHQNQLDEDEIENVKPIDEKILEYYGHYANRLFLDDGIDIATQYDFGLGYDLETHSVTIPIRDELGTLVGVKARLFKDKDELEEWESKYFYLEKCAKSKILFGLNKTMPYIKRQGYVIVAESEKAVMQLWSNGVKNAVAIGSHTISKYQAKKLTWLGVDIVLAYDKDVMFNEKGDFNKEYYTKECDKFIEKQIVYCLVDTDNILEEKESPTDDFEKFKVLFDNKRIIKGA